MGAERNYEKLADGFEILHISSALEATYVLNPNQRTVIVPLTSTDGDITVEMPPLDAAGVPGQLYSIKVTTIATGTVIITDSNALATLWTLDTSADSVLVYSDGLRWIYLVGDYA